MPKSSHDRSFSQRVEVGAPSFLMYFWFSCGCFRSPSWHVSFRWRFPMCDRYDSRRNPEACRRRRRGSPPACSDRSWRLCASLVMWERRERGLGLSCCVTRRRGLMFAWCSFFLPSQKSWHPRFVWQK